MSEYRNQYEDFKKNLVGKDAPWISKIRENAFAEFQKIGFPTRKDEAWKYTNVTPLVERSFPPFVPSSHSFVEQADIDQFTYPGSDFQTLVFVDGEWNNNLSRVYSLSEGCYIQSLSQAFEDRPDLVKKYWGNSTRLEAHAFTALNSAFVHDGAFIYVPKNCIVQKPVHLLYITTEKSKEKSLYLKNFIILEEGGEAEVIETYASTHEGAYFHNIVTSMELHCEAKLDHVRVQHEGIGAFHVNQLDVSLGEKSNYFSWFLVSQ